jgi:hypothetical protein
VLAFGEDYLVVNDGTIGVIFGSQRTLHQSDMARLVVTMPKSAEDLNPVPNVRWRTVNMNGNVHATTATERTHRTDE